jgi:hypothetical protein
MAFLIGGANSLTGGYEVNNSLRWNSGDSASLQQTYTNTGTGAAKTLTASIWIKKSAGDAYLLSAQSDSNNRTVMAVFSTVAGGGVAFENKISGTSSYTTSLATFRDPSAWYHVVWAVDTTQASESNRVKIYINGEQLTDLKTGTGYAYPAEDTVTNFFHDSNATFIGGRSGGNYYNGYMAELNIVDGLQLAASNFGETNDNGVWVPKTPDVSEYGTNGGFYEFKQTGTGADASGMGADTSGKTNHFTVANLTATDVTTDTCTNNFCTVNPLGGTNSSGKWTFSEGNTQIQQNDNGSWRATGSTMAVSKGKWYWEVEFDAGDMREIFVGVHDSNVSLEGTNRWVNGSTLFYNHNGGEIRQDGTNTSNDYGVLTAGDILGVALNMDDNEISFFDNGSAIASDFGLSSYITGFAMPTFLSDSNDIVYKVNFGNAPFAISSGNADANGYGNFEYAVPSGYFALCTKNLAEYG